MPKHVTQHVPRSPPTKQSEPPNRATPNEALGKVGVWRQRHLLNKDSNNDAAKSPGHAGAPSSFDKAATTAGTWSSEIARSAVSSPWLLRGERSADQRQFQKNRIGSEHAAAPSLPFVR